MITEAVKSNKYFFKGEVLTGKPSLKHTNLGTLDSVLDCADACKDNKKCLWWEFNKKSRKCGIAMLRGNKI